MQDKLKNRQKFIRNFSIIAHIDHGKSTLADRILEMTKTVEAREMQEQLLDTMPLERERGITIKLNAIELKYKALNNEEYILHLIDTPGHVDFTYEVSRSLAACEGALLLVDASQGIEAQTLANAYLAIDNDLTIIPVINKIDLVSADIPKVEDEITRIIGLNGKDALKISAKLGIGITDVLEAIVKDIPAPEGDIEKPLKALIFDSYFDQYRGVVALVRIVDGSVKVGDEITFMATGAVHSVVEVGVKSPKEVKREILTPGDVGYIAATVRDVKDVRVGDTITSYIKQADLPLPGYRHLNSMVFCGLFPVENSRYPELKDALEKLKLNDASLDYEPETSTALGSGFRVGFLGLLHMDVIEERIEREFGIDIIATAPSVNYKVHLKNDEVINIDNPALFPDANSIKDIMEPYVLVTIMLKNDYIGSVMELCQKKRGIFKNMEYLDQNRVSLLYEMPLAEIVYDFFDKLKSMAHGYASFDYELTTYKAGNLGKMDILLNGEKVDALSAIVYKENAARRARLLVEQLRRVIPRQLFEIPVQAALGGKIIARCDIKALRKDVLAKCYGGDVSRKKKLLSKQKAGKKRMKQFGTVSIPQSAFLAILSIDEDK